MGHSEPVREQIESAESFVIQGRRPDSLGVADVDEQESRTLRPKAVALSERFDGRGMGACGAAHSAGQARWKPASCRGARGRQRPDVYPEHRLSVARNSYGPATRSTLYEYFDLWSWDGTLDRIHDALYAQCREAASREASPTAAIIDSQSVKSAEKGGLRLIRRATMRARRSRARSGTSSSIRRAC